MVLAVGIRTVGFGRWRQILVSLNVPSEIVIVDHGTTAVEVRQDKGGKRGKGGQILWRWGNPQTYRRGDRMDQQLFCQHSPHFIPEGCPGAGNVLVFNNGRAPDRFQSNGQTATLNQTSASDGQGRSRGRARHVGKEKTHSHSFSVSGAA